MVPMGRTSLTALLSVSATKTSPAASTATPYGAMNPEPMVLMVPSGRTSLTALLGVGDEDVAGGVHRHAERADESGADGLDGAVGQDFFDGVVVGVGDEDVAGRVHRHAPGPRNPEPMAEEPIVVLTVGVNKALVEYWNRAVVVEPSGLTVPLRVALVAEMPVASPVVTEGGGSTW